MRTPPVFLYGLCLFGLGALPGCDELSSSNNDPDSGSHDLQVHPLCYNNHRGHALCPDELANAAHPGSPRDGHHVGAHSAPSGLAVRVDLEDRSTVDHHNEVFVGERNELCGCAGRVFGDMGEYITPGRLRLSDGRFEDRVKYYRCEGYDSATCGDEADGRDSYFEAWRSYDYLRPIRYEVGPDGEVDYRSSCVQNGPYSGKCEVSTHYHAMCYGVCTHQTNRAFREDVMECIQERGQALIRQYNEQVRQYNHDLASRGLLGLLFPLEPLRSVADIGVIHLSGSRPVYAVDVPPALVASTGVIQHDHELTREMRRDVRGLHDDPWYLGAADPNAIAFACMQEICLEIQDELINAGGRYAPGAPGDPDGDGVCNERIGQHFVDNCPGDRNPPPAGQQIQPDADGDGAGDACDNCPGVYNPREDVPVPGGGNGFGQADRYGRYADGPNMGQPCNTLDVEGQLAGQGNCAADGQGDRCGDIDHDGHTDFSDNCPIHPNPDQLDRDGDGVGDACDPDHDNDDVPNAEDNCPDEANQDQFNHDDDPDGDACDDDDDNDGIPDEEDNCAIDPNPDQANRYGDPDDLGDACGDEDNDDVPDAEDSCPLDANPDQLDQDDDGYGDLCDTCPAVANSDEQADDEDGDGIGDVCDNCLDDPNPDQADSDGDTTGDLCDCDTLDGVNNDRPDYCELRWGGRTFSGECVLRDELPDEVCVAAARDGCASNQRWAQPLDGARRCVEASLDPDVWARTPTQQQFQNFITDPQSPMWTDCFGLADARPPDDGVPYPVENGCGWWWTNDPMTSMHVDQYFVPDDALVAVGADATTEPVVAEPGTREWTDQRVRELLGPANVQRGGEFVPHPDALPEGQRDRRAQAAKRPDAHRRSGRQKIRLRAWWLRLPDFLSAMKVGFTYQALIHYILYGRLMPWGEILPYGPCRRYRREWRYQITDPSSNDTRTRFLDHRLWSPVCEESPEGRRFLPGGCECRPPSGIEDKCYGTYQGPFGELRRLNLTYQFADEKTVMHANQAEADELFGQARSYGGYRQGERPPWGDTQGRGKFTILYCMTPPEDAIDVMAVLDIHRGEVGDPEMRTVWTVFPDWNDTEKGGLSYDELEDLWVHWPLIDIDGPFDAVVPESLIVGLDGLIDLYRWEVEHGGATAAAATRAIYAALRRMNVRNVPNDPFDGQQVPPNPDWIYDLFISGSE